MWMIMSLIHPSPTAELCGGKKKKLKQQAWLIYNYTPTAVIGKDQEGDVYTEMVLRLVLKITTQSQDK